jgi:hypothetical protein
MITSKREGNNPSCSEGPAARVCSSPEVGGFRNGWCKSKRAKKHTFLPPSTLRKKEKKTKAFCPMQNQVTRKGRVVYPDGMSRRYSAPPCSPVPRPVQQTPSHLGRIACSLANMLSDIDDSTSAVPCCLPPTTTFAIGFGAQPASAAGS